MFPDELTAARWFEEARWPSGEGRKCPHCGGDNAVEVRNRRPQPFRCRDCWKHFSVRHGTVMEESRIPLRKWAIATYLWSTSLEGVSSMRLHRDLGITQKSAWFMAHRLRMAWGQTVADMAGPVEADETYIGGKEKNRHRSKKLKAGRGTVGKAPVAGLKDRKTGTISATAVTDTKAKTLQGFVKERTEADAQVYTDDSSSYTGIDRPHESVNHSAGEYVDGMAHANGVESFWALPKRGYHGTFHHFSVKHLQRYVDEFATRHSMRPNDTVDMMTDTVAMMVGKRLTYRALVEE